MQINSRDDAHVRLAPLAAAVGHLGLEQFECVQTHRWLGDFEGFAENGAGFVLDKKEGAMGFAFGDFLEEP